MRLLFSGAVLCLASALSGQQASQSDTYRYDPSGNRVLDTQVTRSGADQTRSIQTLNGRVAPIERVEERVLQDDGSGKVTERIIRPYDFSGAPLPPRKVLVEERKNSDGSQQVVTTTWNGDINGRFQMLEKAEKQIRKTASGEETDTQISRPTINGSSEVVERRVGVTTKSGNDLTDDVTTYRRDENGRLRPAWREVSQKTDANGKSVDNTTQYEVGMNGQLQAAGQTVTRVTKNPDGSETKEVDLYTLQKPGLARPSDVQGQPLLLERYVHETKPGANNTVVETVSVQRPTLADPARLDAPMKVTERICSGKCQ